MRSFINLRHSLVYYEVFPNYPITDAFHAVNSLVTISESGVSEFIFHSSVGICLLYCTKSVFNVNSMCNVILLGNRYLLISMTQDPRYRTFTRIHCSTYC